MFKSLSASDIINQISEYILLLDKTGKIIFINGIALDVLGYGLDEVENKPVNMICQMFPAEFTNIGTARNVPAEFKTKNREDIPVILSFLKFKAADTAVRYIITASDNREQMSLQKQMSDILGKLEEKNKEINRINISLNEKSGALEKAVEQLKASEELRIGYISMVYHELKSPLTSAKGALALILQNFSGGLSEKQKELLNIMNNGQERLLRMIEELRDASKIESGTFSIDRYVFDLNHSVELGAALVTGELQKKKLEIVKKLMDTDLYINGDEDRIIQVIINLLGNAMKFSNEGGVIEIGTFRIKADDPAIAGRAAKAAGNSPEYTMLYVRDEGRGIKKESIENVFGKYFQVKPEDSSKHKGMGLGLTIVKGIVEAHDGFVWAESDGEGKGTIFKVLFPNNENK